MVFRLGSQMTAPNPKLIVAGGGLAGCLVALALAQRRPDLDVLILDEGQSFGGNHIWSFFDGDVEERDRWLIEPLVGRRWSDHEVRFPARFRTLGFGYNSVRSSDLDGRMRSILAPDRYRLGCRIAEVGPDHVTLASGERIAAAAVVDARGAGPLPRLDLAWQKFVGLTCRFERDHGIARPIIMDSCVEQDDGYRFVYSLPFSPTRMLVEDTYYSTSLILDVPLVRCRVESYLRRRGLEPAEIVAEEAGVLPILLGGRLEDLWSASDPPVARLGLRGGFFHPTTGYSLPDAVRNAVLLTEQRDLTSEALHSVFRARSASLWRQRRFYQRLNRMLFRAAEPRRRYRVLEHFYRLPEPVIARFYAGRLTALDKLRILSGRPPVPVGRAMTALRERRA
ncbi:MAG TPA: lycopene beta-cyclase CrtY [Allosphingosinicella sp.]|nr:lycopene beta-cyclase CrtY [Allosphingosinicella sp.]